MEQIRLALQDQHRELQSLTDGLAEAAWAAPVPCAGWTVSDVLLHLAQTDEMALASLRDRLPQHLAEFAAAWSDVADVDEGAGRLVEQQRGASGQAVQARWRAAADELRTTLAVSDPHRRVTWVAGELSTMTLATTRLAEAWIHTTDVATALRVDLPTPSRIRHVARLAWRTLPYAFARAGLPAPGPVSFHLSGPDGEVWRLDPGDTEGTTVVTGPAHDLCLVAGQRLAAAESQLSAVGPDAEDVLRLVRTFA